VVPRLFDHALPEARECRLSRDGPWLETGGLAPGNKKKLYLIFPAQAIAFQAGFGYILP
jgi:hypothetical protein